MKKRIKTERQIDDVIVYQDKQLSEIKFTESDRIDRCIEESEKLLHSLGYKTKKEPDEVLSAMKKQEIVTVPSWDDLYKEAVTCVGTGHKIEELFTEKELAENKLEVYELNAEYNNIYKLDKFDISIAAVGGLLGALVDILLVGIPASSPDGLKAKPLSDFVREHFNKILPEAEMEKLANSTISKVPFDAQDNRHTRIDVAGLSAYYHRALQLGHDPFLGFIFGIADIMNGTMTTIDKNGKIVRQVMEVYADRKEASVFTALAKQICHLKSDITTSMGLPVPMMSLFNFLQFGKIGEEEATIAEVVQGMYYEGYDFIHFCSMSIPVMITEIVVRIGYAIKRIKEGHSMKESIPFSLNREKHPKLATMLFVGHSASTAINAGKVAFTKNPMAINYPQWIAFAKYSYSQLKWALVAKPKLRDAYVNRIINEQLTEVYDEIDKEFNETVLENYIVVFD